MSREMVTVGQVPGGQLTSVSKGLGAVLVDCANTAWVEHNNKIKNTFFIQFSFIRRLLFLPVFDFSRSMAIDVVKMID